MFLFVEYIIEMKSEIENLDSNNIYGLKNCKIANNYEIRLLPKLKKLSSNFCIHFRKESFKIIIYNLNFNPTLFLYIYIYIYLWEDYD